MHLLLFVVSRREMLFKLSVDKSAFGENDFDAANFLPLNKVFFAYKFNEVVLASVLRLYAFQIF